MVTLMSRQGHGLLYPSGEVPVPLNLLPGAFWTCLQTQGPAGHAFRSNQAAGRPLSNGVVFFQTLSQLPCGKALCSYEGKEPGDLKFHKGDVILLRRRLDEHWYHGELQGAHGSLPTSCIQCVRPWPQAPPQGKALYDFEMKDRDQDKDCLSFTKVRGRPPTATPRQEPGQGTRGTPSCWFEPWPLADMCPPCASQVRRGAVCTS